jgi:transcription initiation factor TFIID TATA-box-binding protein
MSKGKPKKKPLIQDKKTDCKISNVVASVSFLIDEKIDLVKILGKIENTEYNPESFPGLVLKMKEPKATFLIFSSGKMILTGLRDISEAKKAVEKLIKQLKKVKINLDNPEIKIRNIVATVDYHSFVNLNTAAILMENVMYEPEVFPGLIYYMEDPKAVFLVFSTGKAVCTKIRKKPDLQKAVSKLKKKLEELKIMTNEFEPVQEDDYLFI